MPWLLIIINYGLEKIVMLNPYVQLGIGENLINANVLDKLCRIRCWALKM
jgi:hypothetical protein